MRIAALLIIAIFTFQILDVPPLPDRPNPKTCCGRAVCLCGHAKGALCPFHKTAEKSESQKIKIPFPVKGFVFTKAPCATDAPKTVQPQYEKDFLVPAHKNYFAFVRQNVLAFSSFDALPLPAGRGIEHPPRIF